MSRDLHLDLDGVFLHRTARMPPLDTVGVAPVAAFVSYCSLARTVDAIKVGDWLCMSTTWNGTSCTSSRWTTSGAMARRKRCGSLAFWTETHDRSGSPRPVPSFDFAGLPAPEVNTGAVAPDDADTDR